MAEFTKITTTVGDSVYVNKDHILMVTEAWLSMSGDIPLAETDIGEAPRATVIVELVDGTQIATYEELNALMYRLNKNEMETAVDRLLAHDSNGMVVRVRK